MVARIYKPARTAMQSGLAATKKSILEYQPEQRREVEPLMGWTSSRYMRSQIRMRFSTKEEAIDYTRRNGIASVVREPKPRKHTKKAYGDNFKFGPIGSRTHWSR